MGREARVHMRLEETRAKYREVLEKLPLPIGMGYVRDEDGTIRMKKHPLRGLLTAEVELGIPGGRGAMLRGGFVLEEGLEGDVVAMRVESIANEVEQMVASISSK